MKAYQIDFDAYDLLALSDLVERNFVKCIGERVGVGKESIVFDALGWRKSSSDKIPSSGADKF